MFSRSCFVALCVSLFIVVLEAQDEELHRRLAATNPDLPDVPDSDGNTPTLIAARAGQPRLVELCVRKGGNPDAVANDGLTPLHIGTMAGHYATVKVLIDEGANTESRNTLSDMSCLNSEAPCDGITPLYYASASMGNSGIANLIVSKGADVNAADIAGLTPLFWAVKRGWYTTVNYLLEYNPTRNVVDSCGRSMLHYAVLFRMTSVVASLLSTPVNSVGNADWYWPDLEIRDAFNLTPLGYAALLNNIPIATLLKNAGASKNNNILDDTGDTNLVTGYDFPDYDLRNLMVDCPDQVIHPAAKRVRFSGLLKGDGHATVGYEDMIVIVEAACAAR